MDYKSLVIEELQKIGKSYEWAVWAVEQIDLEHYSKKYFANELAELISVSAEITFEYYGN